MSKFTQRKKSLREGHAGSIMQYTIFEKKKNLRVPKPGTKQPRGLCRMRKTHLTFLNIKISLETIKKQISRIQTSFLAEVILNILT